MNKIYIVLALVVSIIVSSCGDSIPKRLEKKEKESAELLEKEYAEFMDSPRYKQYEERYNELCLLADQVYLTDEMLVTEKQLPTDSLCFEPTSNDTYLASLEENYDYYKVQKFEDYANLSKHINAVIVSSEFCRGNDKPKNTFSLESDLHDAFNALDKDKFIKQCKETDTLASFIYEEFCKARIRMDMMNNAQYFLVLKEKENTPWIMIPKSYGMGDFIPGSFVATIYLYHIEKKKIQYALDFSAENSKSVTVDDLFSGEPFRRDLENNVDRAIKNVLDSAIGVREYTPAFFPVFNQ